MKKIIASVFIMLLILTLTSCTNSGNEYNKKAESDTITSSEDEKLILPANIFKDVTMIKTRLDVSCNSNGISIELEQTKLNKNDKGNYVIEYNLKRDNKINKNKAIWLEYSESGKIQSISVTFVNSTDDIYQLIKIIQYLLQVKELNISVDEANKVYAIFNNPNMKSTWTEKINARIYRWMDTRNAENAGDMQIFSIEYVY